MIRSRNFGLFALPILVILLAFTCITAADQPVPAVPETQGLVTSTGADVVGLATETDAGAWSLTNDGAAMSILTIGSTPYPLFGNPFASVMIAQLTAAGGSITFAQYSGPGVDNLNIAQISIPSTLMDQEIPGWMTWREFAAMLNSGGYSLLTTQGGLHSGALDPGEVRYTTAYDAGIVSQAGHTVLVKSMSINTGNQVAATQSNLKADTLLTYVATDDGGNVVGSENLLVDGAGNTTKASDRMLCPFASQPVNVIPAYCNIVQTGNSYDLTVGTVSSSVSDRFVGTDATIPVQLDQSFSVTPYNTARGSIPAIGSTSAYIKARIQEARNANNADVTPPFSSSIYTYLVPGTPQKAEDLQYSEVSSASGTIQQFTKVIHYQSGKSLMP